MVLCLIFWSSNVWSNSSKIDIYVTPFYNSKGPIINIGKYSTELKSNNINDINLVIEKMSVEKIKLTPEQMFVASIRLYENGKKDEAVYWFYEAQFRTRLFISAIKSPGRIGEKSFELKHAYNAFMQLAGKDINGYAFCDPDKTIIILEKVKKDNQSIPNLYNIFPGVKFIDKSNWKELNTKLSNSFDEFIHSVRNSKLDIKKQREKNNADKIYCI